jgi:hypothetical protein
MVAIVTGVASAAGAAVTATLAFSSGRNMLQTWQTCRQAQQEDGRQKLTDASAAFIMATQTQGSIPVREQVKALQSLDRQEVLQLFLWDCEAPANLAELDGDWNGELLENNGVVLVRPHKLC